MRETCARVLVAALLTAAIATVVGMSTLLGTPSQADPPVAAPPSALERSVRLRALPSPKRHASAPRLVTRRTIRVAPRPEVVARSLVVVRPHRVHRPAPRRRLAAAKPAPAPVVAPPAEPDTSAPAAAPPAPSAPAEVCEGDDDRGKPGKGHDHGRGHDDQDE
jgi:hypothetical protein